jgi:hypothetical protein
LAERGGIATGVQVRLKLIEFSDNLIRMWAA